MAPRLIAAFGTQRNRYATASAIQCYAGIAPVTESSGKAKMSRDISLFGFTNIWRR
jgi:Transposase IS116/IS110/IS902 family